MSVKQLRISVGLVVGFLLLVFLSLNSRVGTVITDVKDAAAAKELYLKHDHETNNAPMQRLREQMRRNSPASRIVDEAQLRPVVEPTIPALGSKSPLQSVDYTSSRFARGRPDECDSAFGFSLVREWRKTAAEYCAPDSKAQWPSTVTCYKYQQIRHS